MGFKDVKRTVTRCLDEGLFYHQERGDIDTKNQLATGEISVEEVTAIIARSRGNNYSCSPHHYDNSIDVHIIKTNHCGNDWYIKWFFVEPDCVFISVHR